MHNPTDTAPQKSAGHSAGLRRRSSRKRRKVRMSVYLTRDEAAALRVAAKRNRSGHLVALLTGRPSPSAEIPVVNLAAAADIKKLRSDLGRIGGNLNQAARKLNQGEPGSRLADVLVETAQSLDVFRERATATVERLENPASHGNS